MARQITTRITTLKFLHFLLVVSTFLLCLPCVCAGQADNKEPVVPKVEMSVAHAKTCVVKVGDVFPDVELPDATSEKPVKLSEAGGDKLTLVLIWNEKLAYAHGAYRAIGPLLNKQFKENGFKGIAINRGDTTEAVKKAVERHGKGITTLVDSDDMLWKKISTSKMPRIYLLDKDRKIIWMDIEFSRGTHRHLVSALNASFKNK